MSNEPPVKLFIGSSSEGLDVAHNLQAVLEGRNICDVEVWDQGVFEPSNYTLDDLLDKADEVDFAVLVASPDDITRSRGVEGPSVRDNIILEFGLFVGKLGRERTYLLATGDAKLPTDLLGLTRLPYRERRDGNLRAAVNDAALRIGQKVKKHDQLRSDTPSEAAPRGSSRDALEQELAILCLNAGAQGWTVKTNNRTTLRLRSPRGQNFVLTKGQPHDTRVELRKFANKLRAGGLRVNNSIRRPVEHSPL